MRRVLFGMCCVMLIIAGAYVFRDTIVLLLDPDENIVGNYLSPRASTDGPDNEISLTAPLEYSIEQYVHEAVDITSESAEVVSGEFAKGDTALVVLNRTAPSAECHALLQAAETVYSLAQIHAGRPYEFVYNPETSLIERFTYEIDANQRLVITREGESFTARLETIEYDVKLAMVKGTIASSLFAAVEEAGEQASLTMLMANVFGWEIDFIKDIRQGDSFSILVEKRFRDGVFANYGKVLCTTFTNQGKSFEAFLFQDAEGHNRYFNPKGESLEKTLLKAPLPFSRVTSGFTMNRKHPILGFTRPHPGIDYAAPTGTPVKAVGAGVATVVSTRGGYGKQVVIKHGNGLETLYSHLSRYGKGMKVGSKVRQGQIIAYVGSTGLSTGPHLDFRIKQHGSFVNPARVVNPRVDDLHKERMPQFTEHIREVRGYMDGTRNVADYTAKPAS